MRDLLSGCAYFALFSCLIAGTQEAFSPAPEKALAFVPGPGEYVSQDIRDRLRAARALHALDAANPEPAAPSPAGRPLASAAQLVVLALPAERGIPDKFLKVLEKVAYAPAMAKVALPLRVAVDYGRTEPRGTYSDATITVAAIDDASEMVKVLTHEIGHRVDVGTLAADKDGADLSDDFYGLSWKDVSVKRRGAKAADFVSGYAQTNRYEDFAESFTFYVFHNRDFAARARKDAVLRAKYDFFRTKVFPDGDYVDTAFEQKALPAYVWDATKPGLDLAKYLKYAGR